MELPPLSNLTVSNSWNLAFRGALTESLDVDGLADSIPSQNVVLNSHAAIVIAINGNARPTWRLAAWCSVLAPAINIGSTSTINNSTEILDAKILLSKPKLIVIPEYNIKPYILHFDFPRWHTTMLLEVWWYDEPDADPGLELNKSIKEDLQRIEQKIDSL